MTPTKQTSATVEHEVASLIKNRKSIRAFATTLIEKEKIQSLFEATRWAPSGINEQPWVYLYATQDQRALWNKFFEPLGDGNKIWVQHAPLLIFSMTRKTHVRNQAINNYALYDLGGANSLLALQAVEMGLQVRQMGGFDHAKTKTNLNIPDEYEMGVFMAVGYPGPIEQLPDQLQQRERAPRERYVQQEFTINGTW